MAQCGIVTCVIHVLEHSCKYGKLSVITCVNDMSFERVPRAIERMFGRSMKVNIDDTEILSSERCIATFAFVLAGELPIGSLSFQGHHTTKAHGVRTVFQRRVVHFDRKIYRTLRSAFGTCLVAVNVTPVTGTIASERVVTIVAVLPLDLTVGLSSCDGHNGEQNTDEKHCE